MTIPPRVDSTPTSGRKVGELPMASFERLQDLECEHLLVKHFCDTVKRALHSIGIEVFPFGFRIGNRELENGG